MKLKRDKHDSLGPPRSLSSSARAKIVGGGAFVLLVLLAGLFLPLPHSAVEPRPLETYLPPGPTYWFGTDSAGFDVFSRVIRSARTDIPIALGGVLIACVIGTPLGVILSRTTRFSEFAMRILDVFQAFPLLIILMVLVAVSGNSGDVTIIIGAVGFGNLPLFIRLVRAESMRIRTLRFVDAAEVAGASPLRVSLRHVMPNATPIALAQFSLSAGYAIVLLAALGYLGIGVLPPTPTWGGMINTGAQQLGNGIWWTLAFPAVAISLTVMSLNLVADGIRSWLMDPRD